MTTNKILELRSKLMPVIKENKLNKVVLFGSRARGDETVDSDYDFYIESDSITDMFELSRLFRNLRAVVDTDVDVVMKPEGIEKQHPIYKQIQEEGVLIYDAN